MLMESSIRHTLSDDPHGMSVESVNCSDVRTVVQTTGATFVINAATGEIEAYQKIGSTRKLATLFIEAESSSSRAGLMAMRVEEHTRAGVILRTPDGRARVQINGDSLLSLSSASEIWMTVRVEFTPAFQSHANGHSMYMDDVGGIAVLPWRDNKIPVAFPPRPQSVSSTENGSMVNVVRVEPGEELWLSVAPTREFDWAKSFSSIYWHRGEGTEFWVKGNQQCPWTPESAWPDDEATLKRIAEDFDILHLQAECALWENWTLGYEPRFPDKAKRCLETAHRLGLKVVVYASPFYFLAGTQFEKLELNVPEWPKDWWRCGNYHGDNWERYTDSVRELLKKYDVDGVYFDSSFLLNLSNSYKMTRRIRSILGTDKILYNHCTYAPPSYSNRISCPALNTYCDFVLRGECNAELFEDQSHLRYCISDYRMGNAVSLLCNSGTNALVSRDWVDKLLKANARLPFDRHMPRDVWQYYEAQLAQIKKEHVHKD